MKVNTYLDTPPLTEMPGVVKREVITARDGAPNFAMRVFDVEPGHSTPYHSHHWEHEAFILAGEGVVKGETGESKIAKDSVVFIAPDELHCFTNTGKETLRFICVIPL
jgi:quercetin dioxygenase-like cupin family protein